jgi:hypothetical protein
MNPQGEPQKPATTITTAQEMSPSIAKEQSNPKPMAAVAKPKDAGLKDVSPLKDAAKVKLKTPATEAAPKTEAGPTVQKSASSSFFGDEDDDIEVLEDDVKTG